MWFEIFKNFYRLFKLKNNFFFYFITLMLLLYFIINLQVLNLTYFLYNCFYTNYYNFNCKNNIQELELMGWGILYYSTFLFVIISYFLLINCLIVFFIINNVKKIKNNLLNYYYIFFLKNKNLYYFNIIKNQFFYIQEYENTYQQNTLLKNFKVTNFFHNIKNTKRRV
jgi:hypothetical protein